MPFVLRFCSRAPARENEIAFFIAEAKREITMAKGKYPGGMALRAWSRLPFRLKHRLVGLALNDQFRYWRDCRDVRCRRARTCQDYECYWRRKGALPDEEQARVRKAAEPLAELLWIGVRKGSEGLWLY